MLDCGMHMGFQDERRFPDFSYINNGGSLDDFIDCVIISHFHLDHCGALPYMSEMIGYSGPIYMTHPTKAICPILLEDFRKISVDKKGEQHFFTSGMIKDCMKKVIACNLHETIRVDADMEIKAYYAGHVLGAAMFHVRVGHLSLVYTGDYNMTPDRHLGAAWIDRCRPDLLITESTYATTIRDSKRCRERDFLSKVHDCIDRGGKVLIPAFALGRAQELCILLETYWERMNLKCPIYFAAGLTEKATNYYKMFITWTNQKIRNTFVDHNMFDFKHIKPFDRAFIDNPGPMVVFATPGMLHAGLSLQIFKKWAPFEENMVIMPGYCVSGTVGAKILNGARRVEIDKGNFIEVKLSVEYLSFSAHADAKGIMQLIRQSEPRNVMLVHGEGDKMKFLKGKIEEEFHLDCYMPANGETSIIPVPERITLDADLPLLKRALPPAELQIATKRPKLITGAIFMYDNVMKLVEPETALVELGVKEHQIRFTTTISIPESFRGSTGRLTEVVQELIRERVASQEKESLQTLQDGSLSLGSALVRVSGYEDDMKSVCVSWANHDEDLGTQLVSLVQEAVCVV